jgi:hypothetical protein
MGEETSLIHVGLQYSDEKKAEIFFTKILEIPLKKKFTISSELSKEIFGTEENVKILLYATEEIGFEVFITKLTKQTYYEHNCIEIKNKKEFIGRCISYGIEPMVIKKDGKDLLFVRDFSGNLFEVKEKQSLQD